MSSQWCQSQSPLILRNLTTSFIKHRSEVLGPRAGGRTIGRNQSESSQELHPLRLGIDNLEAGSGDSPPAWIDPAQQAREDIRSIREKLKALSKAQTRRLLKVFGDDTAPDKDVEATSGQISELIRHAEQNIFQVKRLGGRTEGGNDHDGEACLNAQRSLATQLQNCSQDFKAAQRSYAAKIQDRQRKDSGVQGTSSFLDGDSDTRSGQSYVDTGFNNDQLLEMETMEINVKGRTIEIVQIAKSISDLNTIFKELAVLVIDQGSILDRIDYNIEQVVDQARTANVQLRKTERAAKSNRATRCLIFLVLANAVLLILLIIKTRH